MRIAGVIATANRALSLAECLRSLSQSLSGTTSDFEPPTQAAKEDYAMVDEALYNQLKQWRQSRAEQEHLPPYVIAHNTSLSAIAARKPQNKEQLRAIPGFGVKKVDSYSDEILRLLAKANTQKPAKK